MTAEREDLLKRAEGWLREQGPRDGQSEEDYEAEIARKLSELRGKYRSPVQPTSIASLSDQFGREPDHYPGHETLGPDPQVVVSALAALLSDAPIETVVARAMAGQHVAAPDEGMAGVLLRALEGRIGDRVSPKVAPILFQFAPDRSFRGQYDDKLVRVLKALVDKDLVLTSSGSLLTKDLAKWAVMQTDWRWILGGDHGASTESTIQTEEASLDYENEAHLGDAMLREFYLARDPKEYPVRERVLRWLRTRSIGGRPVTVRKAAEIFRSAPKAAHAPGLHRAL